MTDEERQQLADLIAAGKAAAQKLAHARVLLKADAADGGPAWPDARIAEAVELSVATVERGRQRFVEQGLAAALDRVRCSIVSFPKELGRKFRSGCLAGPARAGEGIGLTVAGPAWLGSR